MNIVPVVLCGGVGSRLWPYSCADYPKQFLSFAGKYSLFQETIRRIKDSIFCRPLILTGVKYSSIVSEQLAALDVSADIVVEPVRRDSCASIAAAAELIYSNHTMSSNTLLLVLAADHWVSDQEAFISAVLSGAPAAFAGRIVTFGVCPTYPSVDYGYIKYHSKLPSLSGTYAVEQFVEKPVQEVAQDYVNQGYLWNSGNFLFSPLVFLQQLYLFSAETANNVQQAVKMATISDNFIYLEAEAFSKITAESIDYAVMEKTTIASVLPCDFFWSDIGTWDAVQKISHKDENGNSSYGNVIQINTKNTYINSPTIFTAAIGVEDLIIIATQNSILVTTRGNSKQLKTLSSSLNKKPKPST